MLYEAMSRDSVYVVSKYFSQPNPSKSHITCTRKVSHCMPMRPRFRNLGEHGSGRPQSQCNCDAVFVSDWPKDVSTMAPYKDGYTDILDERRRTSDLTFMSRARVEVPEYKYRVPRSPEEIKRHVLTSDRVKYTVERVGIHFKRCRIQFSFITVLRSRFDFDPTSIQQSFIGGSTAYQRSLRSQ